MTEAQFQDQVIEPAQMLGWKVAHFRPAKTEKGWRTPVAGDGKGFPDLVMVKPGQPVVYAELKGRRGRLSIEQQDWLDALSAAPGACVCLWRPDDLDEVEAVLRGDL